jgi:hypothetical protein
MNISTAMKLHKIWVTCKTTKRVISWDYQKHEFAVGEKGSDNNVVFFFKTKSEDEAVSVLLGIKNPKSKETIQEYRKSISASRQKPQNKKTFQWCSVRQTLDEYAARLK